MKNFNEMMEEISSLDYRLQVKDIVAKLEPDLANGHDLNLILETLGPETRCFVKWAAEQIQPKTYLEIGTRRGWSTAMVVSTNSECDLYCFDIWEAGYSGAENPGPQFVQKEMEKLGYKKNINFFSGDSKVTVPEFFNQNPDLYFDLILVDGDHTVDGAVTDLRNTLGHVALNGFLIFDDIVICERLDEVWYHMKKEFTNFEYFSYIDSRPGVGIARRIL